MSKKKYPEDFLHTDPYSAYMVNDKSINEAVKRVRKKLKEAGDFCSESLGNMLVIGHQNNNGKHIYVTTDFYELHYGKGLDE